MSINVNRDTALNSTKRLKPIQNNESSDPTDGLFNDLQHLEQAIGLSIDALDMRQPQMIKQLRHALMQLEKAALQPGRFLTYSARHGRHESVLETSMVQSRINQLFQSLDQLESAP